jgi:hypothetical protein
MFFERSGSWGSNAESPVKTGPWIMPASQFVCLGECLRDRLQHAGRDVPQPGPQRRCRSTFAVIGK